MAWNKHFATLPAVIDSSAAYQAWKGKQQASKQASKRNKQVEFHLVLGHATICILRFLRI